MRRLLLALVAGSFAFAVTLAAAASLTVNPSSLGAGVGSAASCDTDGVAVNYTTSYAAGSGYVVTGANVTSINTACDTRTLGLTLVDASNANRASNTATVSGGAAAVTFTSPPPANEIVNAYVVIG